MEPNKEPLPMTNSTNAERDIEMIRNSQGTSREVQAGPDDLNVHYISFHPVPWQNTSNQRQRQPVYPEARPGRSGVAATESGAGSSSQSSSIVKLNSNGGPDDIATPGSSKSGLINNNVMGVPVSMYKVEDKDGINHVKQQPFKTEPIDDRNRESRKRPSSLKLNRPSMDDDSSSLSDYSLGSEDGCIYTYRGGAHLADLPSSFFSLDMGLPADRLAMPNYAAPQAAGNVREGGSRASSPDMEFLEMDFDPGPSNEGDSGEESAPNADLDVAMEMPEQVETLNLKVPLPEKAAEACSNPIPAVAGGSCNDAHFNKPSTSRAPTNYIRPSTSKEVTTTSVVKPPVPDSVPRIVYGPYITHVNARGESILVRRTTSYWVGPASYHLFGGELIPRLLSPGSLPTDYPLAQLRERFIHLDYDILVPPTVYHTSKAKELLTDKQTHRDEKISNSASSEAVPSTSTASASCVDPPRSMVWSEETACERQVTQIGASACGATAVVNAFNALGVPVDMDRINSSVGTRLRANNAPIPGYILSRAVAGCTAADIINSIQIASGGLATARFFNTYPERAVSLTHFLADWISLGAVPILTLNLQNGCDAVIPDSWHHQMVFGVSTDGIYLSNPVECVRENVVWTRLVSASVLLVQARDVVSRFTDDTDLTPLMYVPDARFHTFNVFGQVTNVLRESRLPWRHDSNPRTHHIRIPAAYQAGITIAVLTGTEAHRRLMIATQLPLLESRSNDSPQNDPA